MGRILLAVLATFFALMIPVNLVSERWWPAALDVVNVGLLSYSVYLLRRKRA